MRTVTTVKALLDVLVGREPNEEVIIENGQLKVVATVSLLTLGNIQYQQSPFKIKSSTTETKPISKPLKAPQKKPSELRNSNRLWTMDDTVKMYDLWVGGASQKSLAGTFGRTPKSINCQLSKINTGKLVIPSVNAPSQQPNPLDI